MESALNNSILSKVIAAVRTASHLPGFAVTPETRFSEDLGFDSLDLVEVAMCLEEEFDIEFSQDAITCFGTVADVTTYLSRRYFQDADSRSLAYAA